jgi:predicted hydrocarbon binding protein
MSHQELSDSEYEADHDGKAVHGSFAPLGNNASSFFTEAYELGVMIRKGSQSRVFVLAARAWEAIQLTLYERFSEGARIVLHDIGRVYGKELVRDIRGVDSDPLGMIDSLRALAASAGWGKFEIHGDEIFGSVLKVEVKECVFCENGEITERPNCDFLGGIIGGVVDALFGVVSHVREVKCTGRGDELCEFDVLSL